jgi:SulP family sulfate permease
LSLLTLNIIDEITETRGGNKEAIAQGVKYFIGCFGMGGCAMLGQSLINVSNGARARLSGIAAIALLRHVWCWSNRSFTNGCSYWTDDYGCHWNF